jgi:hypothetical protein
MIVEFEGCFENNAGQNIRPVQYAGRWCERTQVDDNDAVSLVVFHGSNPNNLNAILESRLRANVLVVSNGEPTLAWVETFRRNNSTQGRRVYGATEKTSIKRAFDLWLPLLKFFSTNEAPVEVERFLGLDQPVVRLALRFALEIALEEMDRRSRSDKNDQAPIDLKTLLQPALALAKEVQAFTGKAEHVESALNALSNDTPSKEQLEALSNHLVDWNNTLRQEAGGHGS